MLTEHERIQRSLHEQTPRVPKAKRKSRSVELVLSREEFAQLRNVMKWRVDTISKHPALLLNMSFVNLIAIFDAFLADIFIAVLVSKPAMLKSGKQLSYETIISFPSGDDLIRHMASREIHDVGYKSISDQWAYYRDRFGVEVDKSGVDINEIIEMWAERNLLIHNNGIVNDIYLQSVGLPRLKRGDRVEITLAHWQGFASNLELLATFVRDSLLVKFGG